MRRTTVQTLGVLLLSMTSSFPASVAAQIYQWVDTDGKVHFGDKPADPAASRTARQVELQQDYQPSVRTAQEQDAYDSEQHNNTMRDQVRRREEQQAQEQARAQHREEKAKLCAGYADAIEELSTVEVKNGVRTLAYIKGEDGKPISSDRQREIIEQLKARMAKEGCP